MELSHYVISAQLLFYEKNNCQPSKNFDLGEVSGETIFIDGTKIEASAK